MKMKAAVSLLSLKGIGSKKSSARGGPSITQLGQTAGSHMHEGGLFDQYVEEEELPPTQK